jgi:AcrR family transcriptional regulator
VSDVSTEAPEESVVEPVEATRTRAQPMPPEDRRRMIAEEAVPLFLEHGSSLTTRQLADHLGIAEGTIFRAFGDKDSLVRAAVQTFMEQSQARMADGLVNPALPLEDKVAVLVHGTRVWMQNLFRMLALVPREDIPQIMHRPRDDEYQAAVIAAFQPDADQLTIGVDRLGAVMSIAGVAANARRFGDAQGLTDDELVHFILYGIAGEPRDRATRGKE